MRTGDRVERPARAPGDETVHAVAALTTADVLERAGLDPERFFGHLRVTRAELIGGSRVAWARYAHAVERAWALCDPAAVAGSTTELPALPADARLSIQSATTQRAALELWVGTLAPTLWAPLRHELQELGSSIVALHVHIPEPLTAPPGLAEVNARLLEAIPRLPACRPRGSSTSTSRPSAAP